MKPRKTLFAVALCCAAILGASMGSAHAAGDLRATPSASAPLAAVLTLPALGMLQEQPPPVSPAPEKKDDVDVTVTHETTSWSVSPVWLAIGIIGAIVLVLLIGMAVRGAGSRESTHVVHH